MNRIVNLFIGTFLFVELFIFNISLEHWCSGIHFNFVQFIFYTLCNLFIQLVIFSLIYDMNFLKNKGVYKMKVNHNQTIKNNKIKLIQDELEISFEDAEKIYNAIIKNGKKMTLSIEMEIPECNIREWKSI